MSGLTVVHAIRSDSFSGVERHVAVLANSQADSGDRVQVIGGDPLRMRSELSPGITHVPASTVGLVARAVRSVHREADVVHVHMTAAEAAAAIVAPRRLPLVATRHFASGRGSSVAVRVLARGLRRRITEEIAISHFVASYIEGPSSVVYAGVVSPVVDGDARREDVILVCQRLAPEKNSDLALRAFARSGLQHQGWRMTVAGDGVERKALERLAEDLGIGSETQFLGRVSTVASLMQRSAIFLAPAPAEPFGLSVVEAMAAGLPVVGSDAGGHRETVGAVEGATLFAPDDLDGASDHLRTLARDARLRADYGASLRAAQQDRFTPERQRAETELVYRRAMA